MCASIVELLNIVSSLSTQHSGLHVEVDRVSGKRSLFEVLQLQQLPHLELQ